MTYLSMGDEVLVHIPDEDREAHSPVVKYHGERMVVSSKKLMRRGAYAYYYLAGAKSKYGVPYAFVKDWLIKI